MSLENDRMSTAIHFDSIDIKNKKARMIGNAGAEDIIVLSSASGLTFIESTPAGNMIYTTVFPSYLGKKTITGAPKTDALISAQLSQSFPAVMSRHLFDPLITHLPMPSQFHGYCRSLE